MELRNLGLPYSALAVLPTPFEEAPRFAKALGSRARIFIKRDDSTGLALGGNKARKLEFLIGDAIAKGCDTLITCGGPQSNHARMTAAAARKVGMHPVLVLDGDDPLTRQGNLLLDHLLGAEIVFSGDRESGDMLEEVAERLAGRGKRPYVIPLGGSNPLGAAGYMSCSAELVSQGAAAGVVPKAVYSATGSCGTMAGLLLGRILAGGTFHSVGVAVSQSGQEKKDRAVAMVMDTVELLRSTASGRPDLLSKLAGVNEEFVRSLLEVSYAQVGAGYGIPTPECLEAIPLLARTEGIITDPVYTGKALAGLVKDVRDGRYGQEDVVVFLHTGGAPADFAYMKDLTSGRN